MNFNALADSELILNSDGSIYHLNLRPGEVADTIILVGDPHRATLVANHFDQIDLCKRKREFMTYTGFIGDKRFTVVGTGIGAGNIDIVINELDAVVNIDFETRKIKSPIKHLNFVRLGTTGALNNTIPIDSLIVSDYACGFDGLLHYYQYQYNEQESLLHQQMKSAFSELPTFDNSYVCQGSRELCQLFQEGYTHGITLTAAGFYGPQSRALRAKVISQDIFKKASTFNFQNLRLTNLEMETAIIYGLCRLLGHASSSINAVVANRATQQMSEDPQRTINFMIEKSLALLADTV